MEKKNVVFLTVLAIATLLTAVVGTTFAFFTATVNGNNDATPTTITTATLGVEYSDGAQINATNIAPGWTSKTYTCSTSGYLYDATSGMCKKAGQPDEAANEIAGKVITVTNNSTIPVTYTISWTNVSNQFITVTSSDADREAAGDYNSTEIAAGTPGNAQFKYTLYDYTGDTKGSVISVNNSAIQDVAMPTVDGTLLTREIAAKSGNTATVHKYLLVVEFANLNKKQDENQGKSFSSKLQTTVASVSNS